MRFQRQLTPAETAAKWKAQYCQDGKWGSTTDGPAESTYLRILSGDPTSLFKQWSRQWCNCCKNYKAPTVDIGDDEYCDYICADCVVQIAALFEANKS